MEKEEKEYKQRNKELLNMVRSKGWELTRKKLFDRINDLQSVLNLSETDPEKLVIEVKVRGLVVKELVDWLKEVEGEVLQHKDNEFSPSEMFDDINVIKRLDEVPEE